MNNLTIKTRLIFAIGFLSVLLAIIGAYGLWGMSQANEGLRTVYEDRTVPMGQLDQVVRGLLNNRLAIANSLLDQDDANTRKHIEEIEQNIERINQNWDAYIATTLTPEEKELVGKFTEDRKKFVTEGIKPALEALKKRDYKAADQIRVGKIIPLYPAVRADINDLIQLQMSVAKAEYEQSVSRFNTARMIAISMIVLGITLSTLMGFLLVRGIGQGLASAIDVASKIAAGDLTTTVDDSQKNEIGQLLTAMKAMQSSMQTLIGDIKASTDTINTAAKEIATGNSDLSQRTEEQASSLEETASSMEELTSTVKQNAENAKQANQLAIGASDVAAKGGDVVHQVVTTMDSINESSRKIVDIISVIDGIAFQTNILALNAAVEAARAGEQGRGFAVVAGEVRNLAQRSAAAAKEIKTLIGDSVDKVEGGSKLVAQAGQTMEEIVTSIRRVTDIMSEITAASVEQSAGIEQVNLAITQMDEVTQQNAALVEEAAAAAESLEEQAQSLLAAVSTFKVDERATAVIAPRAAAAAPAGRQQAPARKVIAAPKAAAGKATAVAKPKPKSNDDGEWQEF